MNTVQSINSINYAIVAEIGRSVALDVQTDCLEKLNNLVCYLGNSAEALAKSEYFVNKAKVELLKREDVRSMGTTDRKLMLEVLAKDEVFCQSFSATVNKDLHYAIEGLRSIVSAQKEEFKQTQFYNNQQQ